MDQLWQGIIVALVGSFVTGSAFFAYKHPRAYEFIAAPTVKWLFLAFVAMVIWNAAVIAASRAAREALPILDNTRGRIMDAGMTAMMPEWLIMSAIFSALYLVLLAKLPDLLKMDKKPDPKDGGEGP